MNHAFLGPSRARWMAWLADQIGMQDINQATAKAQLRSVYGESITFPDRGNMKLAGGSIGDRDVYEDNKCLPNGLCPNRPKSSIGPWIFASVLALVLAGGGLVWWIGVEASHKTPTPPAPQPIAGEQPYLKIGGGGPRR